MRHLKQAFILTFLSLSIQLIGQEAFISQKLEKAWEVSSGLNTSESACYHFANNTIYVSNIVGMHNVKDGIGYISKINIEGEIIEKEWVKGLNAPKGIGIANGKLYVTDIDEVVEIDLKTGTILKTHTSSLANSFNDIATDGNGNVFVSEMEKNLILMLGKDSLTVFAESDQISGVNGICDYGNEVIVGAKGNLIAIDKNTKAIHTLAKNTGYLDGIVVVNTNKVITSDFTGKVQLIELGKGIEPLINTIDLKINAADIGYVLHKNLLLVPTFYNNKLIAYKLKL